MGGRHTTSRASGFLCTSRTGNGTRVQKNTQYSSTLVLYTYELQLLVPFVANIYWSRYSTSPGPCSVGFADFQVAIQATAWPSRVFYVVHRIDMSLAMTVKGYDIRPNLDSSGLRIFA